MKGITLCGECGYYNWQKHKCSKGAKIDTDPPNPTSLFYADCPLDDVVSVVRCRDCIGKEHWYWHKTGCYVCGMSNLYNVEDNDFCCYGERRTE